MAQVKIKVRPKQIVRFPAICVHCSRPAVTTMTVRKRLSRITRMIAVPVCTECAAHLARKSGEEERLQKIGWLVSGALFFLLCALGWVLIPDGLGSGLRLLAAAGGALLVTAVAHSLFQNKIKAAYLPEKKAVLAAAEITDFSWRATTFLFENETFTERFTQINEPLLMEI